MKRAVLHWFFGHWPVEATWPAGFGYCLTCGQTDLISDSNGSWFGGTARTTGSEQ